MGIDSGNLQGKAFEEFVSTEISKWNKVITEADIKI